MGIGERTETIEKGDLIVGEIVTRQGLISLVLVDVGIVHIHRSPINVRTVHVHRSMQTGVQIPRRVMAP